MRIDKVKKKTKPNAAKSIVKEQKLKSLFSNPQNVAVTSALHCHAMQMRNIRRLNFGTGSVHAPLQLHRNAASIGQLNRTQI